MHKTRKNHIAPQIKLLFNYFGHFNNQIQKRRMKKEVPRINCLISTLNQLRTQAPQPLWKNTIENLPHVRGACLQTQTNGTTLKKINSVLYPREDLEEGGEALCKESIFKLHTFLWKTKQPPTLSFHAGSSGEISMIKHITLRDTSQFHGRQ